MSTRSIHQISVFELILLTSGVCGLVVSFQSKSVEAIASTAGFLSGWIGARIAMSIDPGRILLAMAVGIVGGAIGCVASLWYVMTFHYEWPWFAEFSFATSHQFGKSVVGLLPRSTATGLLAAGLQRLLVELNARLDRQSAVSRARSMVETGQSVDAR